MGVALLGRLIVIDINEGERNEKMNGRDFRVPNQVNDTRLGRIGPSA